MYCQCGGTWFSSVFNGGALRLKCRQPAYKRRHESRLLATDRCTLNSSWWSLMYSFLSGWWLTVTHMWTDTCVHSRVLGLIFSDHCFFMFFLFFCQRCPVTCANLNMLDSFRSTAPSIATVHVCLLWVCFVFGGRGGKSNGFSNIIIPYWIQTKTSRKIYLKQGNVMHDYM